MRALLPIACARGIVWVDTAARGALVAAPPCRFPFPPPPPWVELRTLWVQGFSVRARWAESFEALQARHPIEPHWYLATLGVHPDAQRRGVGHALVAPLLQRADEDGVATYLETDRAANLPFYENLGFQILEESRVLDTAVWHMQREARAH